MAKTKQEAKQQEEQFLFAINSADGDMIIKIGLDGKVLYIKDGTSLDEAAKAFWNSFESYLPVTAEEVRTYTNDADLGAFIRTRMTTKLQNS